MKYLDRSLAQEIVDRTMRIIDRNINVMDDKGVIIGSGEKKRIDSLHEGALWVIQSQSGFEIGELEAEKLHGVRPGINLPIYFHEKVVGVIGITGPPDEIRSYAELVKMTAEMILQQAVLIEEMQWDNRLREEMTDQLLHGTAQLNSLYFERAKRLGIDLDIPRVAILLSVEDKSKGYKWFLDKLHKDDLYVMHLDHMVLLKKVSLKGTEWEYAKTLEQLEMWVEGLEKYQKLDCKITVGNYQPLIDGLAKSYRNTIYTSSVGGKIDPYKKIYFYEDYKLPVFLARANQYGIGEEIGPYLQKLKQQDKKGELLETLQIYIDENGDNHKAAERLFIHRNTLRYRLDRITELTNKDPRKVKDLLDLYLSVLQKQIT